MNKELQFNRDTSRQINTRQSSTHKHHKYRTLHFIFTIHVHTEMISDPIGLSVGGQKQGIDRARAGEQKQSDPDIRRNRRHSRHHHPQSPAVARSRPQSPAVARSRPYPLLSHAAVENITTTYSSIKKNQSNISGCPNNAFPRWKYSPSRPISYPSYCPRPTPAWPTRCAGS